MYVSGVVSDIARPLPCINFATELRVKQKGAGDINPSKHRQRAMVSRHTLDGHEGSREETGYVVVSC